MKKTLFRLLSVFAIIALLMTAAVGCGKGKNKNQAPALLTGCTIKVQSEGGMPFANVSVKIYTNKELTEMLDFARTDADGVATMKAEIPSGSFIVLEETPANYAVSANYTLTAKETVITLKAALPSDVTPVALGDVMFDFTVTDQYGTEHTLSKLLESKKAVVINLWNITCGPCKIEFPYLQQAYNEYKDDIALLAINQIDQDTDAIAAFASENGLSFPMAPCDPAWGDFITSNPTTIVVDRYGMVAFMHTGYVDKTSTFKNMFALFTADDYKQNVYSDVSAFESDESTLGTAENPFEHTGSGRFSFDVEPSQTVYYTLYGADGMELSTEGDALKLVCNEQEQTATDGSYQFILRAADATAPIYLQFTNNGSEAATYTVSLTSPVGSAGNPIVMENGATTVTLVEGNSHGVYYSYKASDHGTFTLECKNTVSYTVSILNLSNNKSTTLNSSTTKASVDVSKNDQLQIVVIAVEKDGKFPATEAKLNASFTKEETPVSPPSSGTLNTNGTLTNADEPIEKGGEEALNFTADIKAGEMTLYHLYKISGTTLRIADASAYVIYNDKTYKPDSSGYVYVDVTSESTYAPVILKIGNGGTTDKSYSVTFSYPEGHRENPYEAKAGTFKAQIAENNDQGVYYAGSVAKNGKMTVTLKSTTADCDIRVTIYGSDLIPQQYLLSESEDGKALTIDAYAGDHIEINVTVLPDKKYKYPAATIEFAISFS